MDLYQTTTPADPSSTGIRELFTAIATNAAHRTRVVAIYMAALENLSEIERLSAAAHRTYDAKAAAILATKPAQELRSDSLRQAHVSNELSALLDTVAMLDSLVMEAKSFLKECHAKVEDLREMADDMASQIKAIQALMHLGEISGPKFGV